MNAYMTRVTLQTFSYFDTGKGPLGDEPERFYHGFVLGLLAELGSKYSITSNRESGFDWRIIAKENGSICYHTKKGPPL